MKKEMEKTISRNVFKNLNFKKKKKIITIFSNFEKTEFIDKLYFTYNIRPSKRHKIHKLSQISIN